MSSGTTYRICYSNGDKVTTSDFNVFSSGFGHIDFADGRTFDGNIQENSPLKGKMIYPTGESFEGRFQDGKESNGNSKYTFPSGLLICGNYDSVNKKYTKVTFTYRNLLWNSSFSEPKTLKELEKEAMNYYNKKGMTYNPTPQEGVWSGSCTFTTPDEIPYEKVVFTGTFKGKEITEGKVTYPQGGPIVGTYQGHFLNGVPDTTVSKRSAIFNFIYDNCFKIEYKGGFKNGLWDTTDSEEALLTIIIPPDFTRFETGTFLYKGHFKEGDFVSTTDGKAGQLVKKEEGKEQPREIEPPRLRADVYKKKWTLEEFVKNLSKQ